MAFVLVVVGGWFGYRQFTGPDCSGEVSLLVAAAPEIAPAVRSTAAQWVAAGAEAGGTCVAVEVTASEPVDVAAVISRQHGVSLNGIGQAGGNAVPPNVWVPDSSTWLLRLRQQAPGFEPANGASLARSPVVLAMPEPVASSIGWPQQQLGWSDLLKTITTGTRLRTGIVEPSRDAAGLSGLLSLAAAAQAAGAQGGTAEAQRVTTGALRTLATGRATVQQELIARFPRSTDAAAVASGLAAAPLSEQDVIAFNEQQPPVPLAALYLDPAPLSLDYPYAVMPGTEPAKVAAAARLFTALNTGAFRSQLAEQGLRGPDGLFGAGFKAPRGAPSPAGTEPAPDTGTNSGGTAAGGAVALIERALSSWSVVTQSGRMLAVVDVSGSMLNEVPTAGNASRMEVTLQAARRGLGLFDDSWALGLWSFSTELSGGRDYRQLVPIGPLSSQRSRLERELAGLRPKRNGNTGLFDTMLAAYRTVQEDWEPGRVNSVVMLTDGKNEDADGISESALVNQLKSLVDPDRPVQVVIIGIGNEVKRSELESITKVTGGGVFVTEDPAKIGDIFLQAIALRPSGTPR